MLEIEYLGPRVAEVRNPRKSDLAGKSASDKVHGLRWSGADDKVNRMLFQIFFQKLHRRSDPETTGIGTEKIASNPHRSFLSQ